MAIELAVDNTGKAIDTNSKLGYALRYASIGWHVFPTNYVIDGECSCGDPGCKQNNRAKHPLAAAVPFGQSQATTDRDTIIRWWQRYPDANIGVLLSKSNLCAIDIDPRNGGHYTIDEIEHKHGKLETELLQFTGGGGEHRVYYLPEGQKLPGKLGSGIDVKVNGYILVEPSNHISGGVYEWEASSSPLDGVCAGALPDWLRDLTRSVEVPENSKPVSIYPLDDSELFEIKDALTHINSDERDTWLQVGMALHNDVGGSLGFDIWDEWSQTSAKYRQQDQLRVWRSFSRKGLSGITKATIFKFAYDAGWGGVSPAIDIKDVILKDSLVFKPSDSPKQFPVQIMNDLVDWLEELDETPCRQITMQGVLAVTAILASRIYQSSNSNDSSLFLMTLAPTGYGKGYPAKGIKNLFLKADLPHLIKGSGNTSASGVFSALKESPAHIQISDEIGKQYAAARKSSSSNLSEGFAQLTQSYSMTDSIMYERNFSTKGMNKSQKDSLGKSFVINPCITLYSFATPEQVCENLSTSDIDDGFLNRMIIVPVEDAQLPERDRQRADAPQHLVDWCKSMRRLTIDQPVGDFKTGIDTPYDIAPEPVNVHIEKDALQLFKEFHNRIRSEFEGDKLKMAIRWRENAMRMATGMAVAENQITPVIKKDIAQWCIEYVEFYGLKAFELINSSIADNDIHRLRNQVISVLDKAGAEGRSIGQISDYSRAFKSSSIQQRQSIIDSLKSEDLIVEIKKDTEGKGRKPQHGRFYHTKYLER